MRSFVFGRDLRANVADCGNVRRRCSQSATIVNGDVAVPSARQALEMGGEKDVVIDRRFLGEDEKVVFRWARIDDVGLVPFLERGFDAVRKTLPAPLD